MVPWAHTAEDTMHFDKKRRSENLLLRRRRRPSYNRMAIVADADTMSFKRKADRPPGHLTCAGSYGHVLEG